MDKEVVICRCEEVTRAQIEEAIERGLCTPRDIKQWTRAGMGLCQGCTCRSLICQIVAEKLALEVSEVSPLTFRPPVRHIKLKELAGLGGNDK